MPPFCWLPLHLRFFTEDVRTLFEAATGTSEITGLSLQPVPPTVTTVVDLGGVLGRTGHRGADVQGVTSRDGPIDVTDASFRDAAWRNWRGEEHVCAICANNVEVSFAVKELILGTPRRWIVSPLLDRVPFLVSGSEAARSRPHGSPLPRVRECY